MTVTIAACPECGRERTIKRASYPEHRLCMSCSGRHRQLNRIYKRGRESHAWKGTEHISHAYYNDWRRHGRHEWKLTIDDVEAAYIRQSGRCALTGRVLTTIVNDPDRISLDRINSAKPYEVGNIQLTTAAANLAKHWLPVAEFVKLAADVIKTNSVPLTLFLGELETEEAPA